MTNKNPSTPAAPHRNRKKELGKNLLLSIISAAVFLGGSELIARIWYTPKQLSASSIFEYDSEKLFRLKSNQNTTFKEVPFTTNSFGQRNSELSMEKPEETKRVLLLGDSITFGFRVRDNKTLNAFLEQKLNAFFAEQEEQTTVEVLNTAAPGNSPLQEYVDLKRGLAFNPDVVVLQLTLNDIIEDRGFWILEEMGMEEGAMNKSPTQIANYIFGTTNFPYIDHVLRRNSALYCMLNDWAGRLRFRDISGEEIEERATDEEIFSVEALAYSPNHPTVRLAWERTLDWIEKIHETTEAEGIPLVLVFTPYDFQFPPEAPDAPQQKLAAFAKEQGIPFIDLLAALREMYKIPGGDGNPPVQSEDRRRFWDTYFLDYDHPSPAGHALIADLLYPIMTDILLESEDS